MSLFSKRRISSIAKVNVSEVKVANVMFISSSGAGLGAGPMCTNFYLLVREEDGKYYELFSDRKIEKESDKKEKGSDEHSPDFTSLNFDKPYIRKIEPLTNYLRNPKLKAIKLHLLFDFLLCLNVEESFEKLDANEE